MAGWREAQNHFSIIIDTQTTDIRHQSGHRSCAKFLVTDIVTSLVFDMSGSKYEGCGEIGDIRAVFLSQFHPDQGPMIRCQWPADFLSKENFDSLSSFIIPKNELQAHTITVNCLGYKISGYPTYLHDRKYRRNYLLFTLCIASYPWSRTVQFESIVRKLSQFFINLEKESSILHLSGGDNDIKEEARLEKMLEQVKSTSSLNLMLFLIMFHRFTMTSTPSPGVWWSAARTASSCVSRPLDRIRPTSVPITSLSLSEASQETRAQGTRSGT